jgi:hypothetical protein
MFRESKEIRKIVDWLNLRHLLQQRVRPPVFYHLPLLLHNAHCNRARSHRSFFFFFFCRSRALCVVSCLVSYQTDNMLYFGYGVKQGGNRPNWYR